MGVGARARPGRVAEIGPPHIASTGETQGFAGRRVISSRIRLIIYRLVVCSDTAAS